MASGYDDIAAWKRFETTVRDTAALRWGKPCTPATVAGVDVDGVIELDGREWILIEMTIDQTLEKVRTDISKLDLIRRSLMQSYILARTFIVLREEPTPAMRQAGESLKIDVMSFETFSMLYFDAKSYIAMRSKVRFGSAANPFTGAPDETGYVPVRYDDIRNNREIDVQQFLKLLRDTKRVVLLGDYGTGKSRCVKELFSLLSADVGSGGPIPIALNLREHWGSRSAGEILRRHLDDLGLSHLADTAVRTFADGPFCFLLDGFDEIGSQSWSENQEKMRAIRKSALDGVRELVQRAKGPVLLTGREQYFRSHSEMFDALGLQETQTHVVESKNEFDAIAMAEFLSKLGLRGDFPPWLPRRPLVCQILTELNAADLVVLLEERNQVEFWRTFIETVCRRESEIRKALDPETIRLILTTLAHSSRQKSGNVGPFNREEIARAFASILGASPGDESALVLERLPGMGRLKAETDERSFVDDYVLDGLRAESLINQIQAADDTPLRESWLNPLSSLGLRLVGSEMSKASQRGVFLVFAKRALAAVYNRVLAADVVGAFTTPESGGPHDLQHAEIVNSHFHLLDLSLSNVSNLKISDTIIDRLVLGADDPAGVVLDGCEIARCIGVSQDRARPDWVLPSCRIEAFDEVSTTSRVRETSLSVAHKILLVVLRKTFFQRGAGRQEQALTRGLGKLGDTKKQTEIIRRLVAEGFLTARKGDHGTVYVPERNMTGRAKEMCDSLDRSKDPLWLKLSELR